MKIVEIINVPMRNGNVVRKYNNEEQAQHVADILADKFPSVSFQVCAHPTDDGFAIISQKPNKSHAYVGYRTGPTSVSI